MLGQLMVTRRFAPLFWCQFFSAFNDNFVKNVLVILILFRIGGERAGALVTLAGAVFILPFFIFSGLGGQMADRYDKALVARRLKLIEIAVAAVAALGFAFSSLPILFSALFGLGLIGALFGPIKYGILPDHLAVGELPSANALVEGATFLAILTGTIAGGVAAAEGDALSVAILMMAFAFACWLTSLFIPATGEAAPALRVDPNIARSTVALLRDLWGDTRLWRGGLVISWFWLVGAVALSLMPTLVKDTIGGTEEVVTTFLAVFSIAIAIGSLLAAWLAAGRIILLPTPVAALLMGGFALDLGFAAAGGVPAFPPVGVEAFFQRSPGLRIAVDLAGLAVAGGLFIVPYFAAVQAWAGADRRARIIAAVNVLNAAFMTVGALVVAALQGAGVSVPMLFGLMGALNILVGILIFRTMPTSALKDFLSIVFRAVYRVELKGRENIDKAGPRAIVAVNHMSFLDGPLMLSLLDRAPVMAVDRATADRWWIRPFLKPIRAKPLKPARVRTLIEALKAGEPLVIFVEGRLTVTDSPMKAHELAGFIADKTDATVVPVRIEGLEASAFSRLSAETVRKRWFPRVTVTVLEPVTVPIDRTLKGSPRRRAAGTVLHGIISDLAFHAATTDRTVVEAVIEAAQLYGRSRVAVMDPAGALSYDKLLLEASIVGRKLMPLAAAGKAIGVMLPNGTAAATTVLGLMSAGRVPAMIDATAGAENVIAACKAAAVEAVVTQRSFVEKRQLQSLVEALADGVSVIYLEEVRASVGLVARLRGLVAAETPILSRKPHDPATILFAADTDGGPTGIVLSHRNLVANAAQAAARIDFDRTDTLFNALPVMHPFGLTVGLVLPLVSGLPLYLYASLAHDRHAPDLLCRAKATILLGDDTFLARLAGYAHPHDVRSLRFVLAGGEPVKEATRRGYVETFGLRIFEGYGLAMAPVIALNTPMFNRFGTVGRLLPGMEMRLEPVPGLAGGRLHVKGPNVTPGHPDGDHAGPPEGLVDGWRDTGDIVTVEDGGFLRIEGRATRFARVGGEMISLAAVERVAAELWPEASSAAVALPDPGKGERLVLVTSQPKAKRAAFQANVRDKGERELMVPAAIVVANVPRLPSGMIDYAGVSHVAREKAGKLDRTREQEAADALA